MKIIFKILCLIFLSIFYSFATYSQLPYNEYFFILENNVERSDSLLSARGYSFLGAESIKKSSVYRWAYNPDVHHKSVSFISSMYMTDNKKMVLAQMSIKSDFDSLKNQIKNMGFKLIKTSKDSAGVNFVFTDKEYEIEFTMEGLKKGHTNGMYFVTFRKSKIKMNELIIRSLGEVNIVLLNDFLIKGEEYISKEG